MTQRPVTELDHNENTIRNHLQYNIDDTLYNADGYLSGSDWVDWKRQAKS